LSVHDIHEKTLSNGMRILFVRTKGMPRMACRIYFRGGASVDPFGREGTAALAARIAFDGTRILGTRSYDKEKSILERIQSYQAIFDREKIDPVFLDRLRAIPLRMRSLDMALRNTLRDLGASGRPPMTLSQMRHLLAFVTDQEEKNIKLAEELSSLKSTSQYFRLETRNSIAGQIHELRAEHRSLFLPDPIERAYTRRGGTGVGALLYPDFTAFAVDLPTQAFEVFFWVEADRMRHLMVRDFPKAKASLTSEIRAREANAEVQYLRELYAITLLHHPLGRSPQGRQEIVSTLTREEVLAHYRSYFTPPRAVLVCVGDSEPVNFFARAMHYFEFPPPSPGGPLPAQTRPRTQSGVRRLLCVGNGPSRVDFLFPAPAYGRSQSPALGVVAECLRSSTGHLVRDLDRKNLAWSVEVEYRASSTTGVLRVSALLPQGADPAKAEAVILKTLDNLSRWGFTADAIQGAVNRLSARWGRTAQDPGRLAHALGAAEMRGGWKTFFDRRQSLSRLTLDDIKTAYNATVRPDRMTVGVRRRGE
jgi:zinc protease